MTTKEGDGEVMVEAAPGAEKEEDLVTITYASDVTFEILTDIVNIGLHFILKNVRPYAASCSEA